MIFTGFHGTSRSAAKEIKRVNFKVNNSPKGWLGRGVYFFEEGKEMASYWPTAVKKISNYALLESVIEVDEKQVLDLRIREVQKIFHEAREEYSKVFPDILKQQGVKGKIDERCVDGVVIDLLCRKEGKLLAILETYTYQEFDRNKVYRGFSRIPNGTELCVKEVGIIKETNIIN